uniref:Uncharacterized protein n=1 Tax=Glossina brevipalpis TaxID=37001 RepID=A0A1A9WRA6_9MUSC
MFSHNTQNHRKVLVDYYRGELNHYDSSTLELDTLCYTKYCASLANFSHFPVNYKYFMEGAGGVVVVVVVWWCGGVVVVVWWCGGGGGGVVDISQCVRKRHLKVIRYKIFIFASQWKDLRYQRVIVINVEKIVIEENYRIEQPVSNN